MDDIKGLFSSKPAASKSPGVIKFDKNGNEIS
jgi:hypothetical protein